MIRNRLNLQEVLELAERKSSEPAVSIFMPTHRIGDQAKVDQACFDRLWRDARKELADRGMRRTDIEKLSVSVARYAEDSMFWSYQSDGLALFVSSDFLRVYQVPMTLPTRSIVSSRFHVRPLLSLVLTDERFFLLGISLKKPRLFEGCPFGVDELEEESLPKGLDEILQILEVHKELQARSIPGGGGSGVVHGHDPSDRDKVRAQEYLRELGKSVDLLLKDESAPLILAGVDYLQAMYRQTSSYPHLIDKGLSGNPDQLKVDEIGKAVDILVRERSEALRTAAVERFGAVSGTGKTSSDPAEISEAAVHGRVDVAFLALGELPTTDSLESDREGDIDLEIVELVASTTLKNGGKVYCLPVHSMPGKSPMSAIFRY